MHKGDVATNVASLTCSGFSGVLAVIPVPRGICPTDVNVKVPGSVDI